MSWQRPAITCTKFDLSINELCGIHLIEITQDLDGSCVVFWFEKYDLHVIIITSVCFNNATRGVYRTYSTINILLLLNCVRLLIGRNHSGVQWQITSRALFCSCNGTLQADRNWTNGWRVSVSHSRFSSQNQTPHWYFNKLCSTSGIVVLATWSCHFILL